MTTPAIRTIRENFPKAEISVLVNPWVAEVFAASPFIDNILLYKKTTKHKGIQGMWRLGRELSNDGFDLAILLQNAFEAAFICKVARIPALAGYKRDCRGPLLSHGVDIPGERLARHQVHYYQGLMADLGLTKGSDELFLELPQSDKKWASDFVAQNSGKRGLIGLNPGAAYGPAKRWPAERYGEVARKLWQEYRAATVVFGTEADSEAARIIVQKSEGHCFDMTGKTSLSRAMALIGACDAFVTNDSGLMHVAAALKTPLVAIFGSTDHVATGPFFNRAVIVRREIFCSPCLKTHCKKDFECMMSVSVADVLVELGNLLQLDQS